MPSATTRRRREYSISSSDQIALLPTISLQCESGHSTPSCYSLPSYHSSPGTPSPESDSDDDVPIPSITRPLPPTQFLDTWIDDSDEALTLRGSYDSFFAQGFNDRRSRKESGYDPSGEETSSGSESDFDSELDDDIRSASPSICATATKVKITPLRAVRRTIRRSVIFDRPRKSSAEEGMFNPYWRAFKTAFNDPSPTPDYSHDGSSEKVTPIEPLALPQPLNDHPTMRKMSLENLKKLVPLQNTSDYLSVDPLENPVTIKRSNSLPINGITNDYEIDIMELHDVTQEAAQITAMLNFKWKFEPAADQVHRSRELNDTTHKRLGWSRRLAD